MQTVWDWVRENWDESKPGSNYRQWIMQTWEKSKCWGNKTNIPRGCQVFFCFLLIFLTSLFLFVYLLSHHELSHCRCKQTNINTRYAATKAFLKGPWRLSCWVWTTDVWQQADLCQRVSTSSFISPEQTASGHHAKQNLRTRLKGS